MLEYLGLSVDLRAALHLCGQFAASAIPAFVLENLASTNTYGDGIIEASAD